MRYIIAISFFLASLQFATAQDVKKNTKEKPSVSESAGQQNPIKEVAPAKSVKKPIRIESRARSNSPKMIGRPTGGGKPEGAVGGPGNNAAGRPAGAGIPGKGKGKPAGVGKPGG